MADVADDCISFLGKDLGPEYEMRCITVEPGCARPYDESEWLGALVVVEQGDLELECARGGRRCFHTGAVLWLCALPLRALHNSGTEPVLLSAVTKHR